MMIMSRDGRRIIGTSCAQYDSDLVNIYSIPLTGMCVEYPLYRYACVQYQPLLPHTPIPSRSSIAFWCIPGLIQNKLRGEGGGGGGAREDYLELVPPTHPSLCLCCPLAKTYRLPQQGMSLPTEFSLIPRPHLPSKV